MAILDEVNADRSLTDAITNKVVLRGLDSIAYLKWFAHRTTKMEPVIPQFMHEFTHHWCFDSSVGRAIAFIRMRAAFTLAFEPNKGEEVAALDLSKYLASTILLKPITEGLALFAECDAYSGDSKVNSPVITALLVCFGFPIEGERGQEFSLLALLQGTRLTPDFLVERKARLYFKPFDIDDAYLPGYLSVKALHAHLKVRVPAFFDPDLFLSFIRTYFYQDPLLVEALLSGEKNEFEAAVAVATRINRRLAELVEDEELPRRVELFENSIADGQIDLAMTEGIGITPEDSSRADETFSQAVTSLVGDLPRDDEHMRLAAGAILANIQLRRFMVVASAPVEISADVDGAFYAVSTDGEKLATVSSDEMPLGQQCELLFIIDTSATCGFQVIKRSEQIRIVKEFGKSNENREALMSFVLGRELIQQISDLLEDELTTSIRGSLSEPSLNHIKNETVRIAMEQYVSVATLNVKDEELARVKDLLQKQGLRPFIREDPTLARVLAGVGLINTISSKVGTIIGMSGAFLGLDNDVVRESIEQLDAHIGMPLLIRSGENLFALV
jgi:hypothetical protein